MLARGPGGQMLGGPQAGLQGGPRPAAPFVGNLLPAGPRPPPPPPEDGSALSFRWHGSKFMLPEEIDTILRIQWKSLHNGSPYQEDYYYQVYLDCFRAFKPYLRNRDWHQASDQEHSRTCDLIQKKQQSLVSISDKSVLLSLRKGESDNYLDVVSLACCRCCEDTLLPFLQQRYNYVTAAAIKADF